MWDFAVITEEQKIGDSIVKRHAFIRRNISFQSVKSIAWRDWG